MEPSQQKKPCTPKRHLVRLGLFLLIALPLSAALWTCSPVYHTRINTNLMACLNNMHQVAFAVRIAADYRDGIPAYTVNEDGKPLHSWRTLILPMIEMRPLYDKIRLDEPWDSEYNRQFHDVVIPLYHCRSDRENKDKPTTNYFLVTGPGSLFDGSKPVRSDDFPDRDSTSTTPFLIESQRDVHWMCPEDVSLDDYTAGVIPPIGQGHRNIIYTDLRPEILFAPPWLSYFSPTEVFFGHYLPLVLFWLIPIVTVIQIGRYCMEKFQKKSRSNP